MYDALIIVNGEIPRQEFLQKLQYQTIICTDGAANSLQSFGFAPDIIIGDMDSISKTPSNATSTEIQSQFPTSTIIQITDQDSTDFQKALDYAVQHNLRNILCIGTFGKAADHSIYNLCLLYRYHNPNKLRITLLHYYDDTPQWIFVLPPSLSIEAPVGSILSFFPLHEATLSTQGLQWEIENTLISQLGTPSVRNKTRAPVVQIQCKGPCLCLISTQTTPIISYT